MFFLIYCGSETLLLLYNDPQLCIIRYVVLFKVMFHQLMAFVCDSLPLLGDELVAEVNFDALYTQRAALFKEYSQNYDCRTFVKLPEQQWYTVY